MKIEWYKDEAGEFRWRVKAANGEIIGASSEGFDTLGSAQANLEQLGEVITFYGLARAYDTVEVDYPKD
jgi:uncharacterized protein YegP (UPF0339 family)